MEDKPPRPLKIAAAQLSAACGDLRTNVGRVVEMLERAQQEGVKLVVFPELFLTGHEPDLVRLDPSLYAIHEKDARLAPIVAACDRMEVAAIVGAATHERATLYNSLLVFSASGELSATYHKQHLFPDEVDVYERGEHAYVLHWGDWKFGLAISCDAAHPGHADAAGGMECHAYLVGASSGGEAGGYAPRAWMAARARENAMYVLMADHGAQDAGGGSAAWAPDGQSLAQAPDQGQHLVSITLAFSRLREAGLRAPMSNEQLEARMRRRPRFDHVPIQSLRERRGDDYTPPVDRAPVDMSAVWAEMLANLKPPSMEQAAQWAEERRMWALLTDGCVEELEREAARRPGFPHGTDGSSDRPWIGEAINSGALGTVAWMISRGVDLSFVDPEGYSAVMLALELESDRQDKYAILELLLRSGAPTDRHGFNFWTAMHLAAVRDDVEGLRLLRQYGADLRAISYDYWTSTPAEDARSANSWKALAFLDQAALDDGLPP